MLIMAECRVPQNFQDFPNERKIRKIKAFSDLRDTLHIGIIPQKSEKVKHKEKKISKQDKIFDFYR